MDLTYECNGCGKKFGSSAQAAHEHGCVKEREAGEVLPMEHCGRCGVRITDYRYWVCEKCDRQAAEPLPSASEPEPPKCGLPGCTIDREHCHAGVAEAHGHLSEAPTNYRLLTDEGTARIHALNDIYYGRPEASEPCRHKHAVYQPVGSDQAHCDDCCQPISDEEASVEYLDDAEPVADSTADERPHDLFFKHQCPVCRCSHNADVCPFVHLHKAESPAKPELQLLVIDLGDACVVKLEAPTNIGKGAFRLKDWFDTADEYIYSGESTLVRKVFADIRAAIDAMGDEPPAPRIERASDSEWSAYKVFFHNHANNDHDMTWAKDQYENISELVGHALPVWTPRKGGTWVNLQDTTPLAVKDMPIGIWRYTLEAA